MIDYEKEIEKIGNDSVNGSTTIALNALLLFCKAFKELSGSNCDRLMLIGEKLRNCKPEMAALSNIMDAALSAVRQIEPETPVVEFLSNLSLNIRQARQRLILRAYSFLSSEAGPQTYITCSYSSAVIALFEFFKEKMMNFSVGIFTIEDDSFIHSFHTFETCRALGINTKYVSKDMLPFLIPGKTCIVLGADAYDNSGNVLNGAPSFELARLSRDMFRLFILAESFKKTDMLNIGKGFDFIDRAIVRAIISEEAIFMP